MANQPNPVDANWLEFRVRISPRLCTFGAYCMLQSEGFATGQSDVQKGHTEHYVLMSVI